MKPKAMISTATNNIVWGGAFIDNVSLLTLQFIRIQEAQERSRKLFYNVDLAVTIKIIYCWF